MSQGTSPTPPAWRNRPRPPRIHINRNYNGSALGSYPATAQMPYTAQTLDPGRVTAGVSDQPYWPTYGYNPFAKGNFMAKGFEGIMDFTKSGMSFGEKFTFGLYDKISKWSRKWFTHMFLLFVMTLYTVCGALLFSAIEGRHALEEQWDRTAAQKFFFKAMQELSQDYELRRYQSDVFNGNLVATLREHQKAVESLLSNKLTIEEMQRIKGPWTFWNAMFYCGTIYTTIGMERQDYGRADTTNVRRRRRLGRPMREKTPDPNFKPNGRLSYPLDNDENEDVQSQVGSTTASEEAAAQVIRMQIMPPNKTRSAHESKILRKRDKNFSTTARSHSQPRAAERLSSPEANELLRTGRRSLSFSRNENLSESEWSTEPQYTNQRANSSAVAKGQSRLEQNLHRFEEERKRFEAEKRQFEKERRELKLRHKQLLDNDERRRLLQAYYKQTPQDAEERRRLVHSLRLPRSEAPTVVRRAPRHSACDESSTQFSSSEAEETNSASYFARNLSPLRRSGSNVVANVRGPPPPPPVAPARRSASRNSSLSPVRPNRCSETVEQQQDEIMRRLLNEEKRKEDEETSKNQLRRRNKSLDGTTYQKQLQQSAEENVEVTQELQSNVKEPVTEVTKETATTTLIDKMINFLVSLRQQKAQPIKKLIKDKTETFPARPAGNIFVVLFGETRKQWQLVKSDYPQEVKIIKEMRNKCLSHIVILILLCGFGGLMFRYTEGSAENVYKCDVRKVKRDFIDNLWTVSHNMREDEWKTLARQKLRKFEEELHSIWRLGMSYYYPGQKSWNFVNCILYCWTIITTIGYGHITPKTRVGQSLTIVYAIIGIPMFLILLADFGKLFTRCMKFLWVYVRRLYYTGTCRSIRKQQQVQDAIGGFNTMYDIAIRRPSLFFRSKPAQDVESTMSEADKTTAASRMETPTSPYPETIEIDDEFNLPVSLASVLLISYILIGTVVYTRWEEWSYFEAFYFVFISMSTIGLGDLVPNHPIFMMCSIIYLIFGLALTSMFINVVQIKLSDTFKQASYKLGATMGLDQSSNIDDDTLSHPKTPSELAPIHAARLSEIPENELEIQPPPIDRRFKPINDSDSAQNTLEPPPRREQTVNEKNEPNKKEKKKRRFF